MKKIVFMLLFAAMYLFTSAQEKVQNYVITNTDTIFCKKINEGSYKTRCEFDNGAKIVVSNKNIKQYQSNSNFKKRLPIIINGRQTNATQLMDLVLIKNGVSVYKYEYYSGSNDCLNAMFYYFVNGECVRSDKNPLLKDLNDFIAQNKTVEEQTDNEIELVQN
jgi:hypothetical protein